MEDLSRNLGGDSKLKRTGRANKAQGRLTVLLISDLGQVVSFHLTKPLLLILIACFAAGLTVFVYSVVSYNSVESANERLRSDLDILSTSLKGAERDREEALVHLMLLEEGAKQNAGQVSVKLGQGNKDVASEVTETNSDTLQTAPSSGTASQSTQPEGNEATAPPMRASRVSVEDLEILAKPETDAFEFQFVVKNTDRQGGKVAGYAFVVLKPKENSEEAVRVFPSTALEDGMPSNFQDGHHFSITHYMPIRGTLKDIASVGRFGTATVYVYSNTGNLMVEEVFEVNNRLRS